MSSTPAGDFRQPLRRKPPPVIAELVDHMCSADFCGRWGSFGLGPPILPATVWFCATHKPADYYTRGGAKT